MKPTAPKAIRWTSDVDPYGGRAYHGEPLALLTAVAEAGEVLKQAAEAYREALRRLPQATWRYPTVHVEGQPDDIPSRDDLTTLLAGGYGLGADRADAVIIDRLQEAFAKALVQDVDDVVGGVERMTGAIDKRLAEHVAYHLGLKRGLK